jgi:iron complex transport system substrate-binding protein
VSLIEGYAELAETLGADADQITEARAEFDAAVADFQAATAEKPGLTALAISPYDTSYAIAVPEHAPELLDFQRWGLNVINPDAPDPDFPYWETLSMENADKYQPDLLLFDDRWHPGNEETLAAAPIAASIHAYAAGQTTTWPGYWLHTYGDYAAELTRLAEVIRGADENLVQE